MIRAVVVGAFLASFLGCSSQKPIHAWFTRTRNIHRSPKSDRGLVRIFTSTRPQRPYQEVGIITAQARVYHYVLGYAQQLAARIGCDAILAMGSAVIATGATTGGAQVYLHNQVRGRFACVVWR